MKTVLALGGNIGDRHAALKHARELISTRVGRIVGTSTIVETAPSGFRSEHLFLNQILIVETELPPTLLLDQTQIIERTIGRTAKSHDGIYTDRIIDIDIVDYEGVTMKSDNLTLPHPLMHTRAFVLQPLCEIWSDWTHPILQKTAQQLLASLKK